MKVILTFFGDWTKKQLKILIDNKIKINQKHGFIDIEETQQNAELIKEVRSWHVTFENAKTVFTKSEFEKSSILRFTGVKEIGYPQPESVDEYMKASYDLTNYCAKCGIGAIQNRALRISKEPNFKEKLYELNWIADEFIVQKELYDKIFHKRGISKKDIVIHKSSKNSCNYFQLSIPIVDIKLSEYNFPIEHCNDCGKSKFIEMSKGFFPKLKLNNAPYDIFKTSEHFGVGGGAYNLVFITNRLYKDLIKENIKLAAIPTN